jgi:hypothetical protein
MSRPSFRALTAVVVLLGSLSVAAGAAGQAVPPVVAPPADVDPSPHIRVLLARLEVLDAEAAMAERQRSAADAEGDRTLAQAALDGALAVQGDAERTLDAARARLGSTAVYAYMNAPNGQPDVPGDATTAGQERALLRASIDHHQHLIREAEAAVDRARADVDVARAALAEVEQVATDRDDDVAAAADVLADARDELDAARAEARQPYDVAPWQLSIEGHSAFTVDELTRWYDAQGHGSRASVPIAELVRDFVEQGDLEGVRGDMAFAQAIHETGWFANTDTVARNNFAGIGHCTGCPRGYAYPTAELGARAQLQLLESYADATPVYDLPRADPDLDGPAGCCPAWSDLGGVWATDGGYGPRILARYAEMLAWLVADRSAGVSR